MSEVSNPVDGGLTPLRKALLTIERLQTRVRALESERVQQVAVVGIGCRTPGGGRDATTFFDSLIAGRDAIQARPPVERFEWAADLDLPPAGYLDDDLKKFDAGFFGVSPREAMSIDPQHRLLLECAWEALEHAGIDPHSLAGSRSGVFLGMAGNDYANEQLRSGRTQELLHSHFASGTGHSMASGRLSYLLGLHGPSMTVDTACSSSLVAVHLACQSLRTGETDLAFAAGVNLILSTDYTAAFHQARMLAPDGRCKTFDAAADGFSRAEGCGVVILKRLSDAQRDGDRILAVIRGSAVNQDGPSSGLTAPNGPAQEAVIRAALAQAKLQPADIGYIETHGTGTSLGDPIEVQALGAVFGDDRTVDQPLLIGSVKTNVGHLEAAAGITGLIKAIEAVRRRVVPASLHFSTPNPHIPWTDLPLQVPTSTTPFPAAGGVRRAGVSSFGFSGTNAHVIVEEPPESAETASQAPERMRVLTVSAATADALRVRARDVAAYLSSCDASFADVSMTANAGRAHFPHRLAVCAGDNAHAALEMEAWLRGDEPTRFLYAGRAASEPTPLAFLFTGQGAQYRGMAWSLRAHSPVVRRVLDQCDDLLRDELDVPLLSVIDPAGANAALIDRTDYTQPALFAVQVALAELWRSWGIRPAVVVGHSIGEYAAAHLAGVFSLEDALRVVAARGRLMQNAGETGRMIAVMATEERVHELLQSAAGLASIAAINAPDQIVVSGSSDAVSAVESAAHASGVQTKSLRTSQAFHSPVMDAVVPQLEAVLRTVTLGRADNVRFISTVTGAAAGPDTLSDPAYWSTQVRLPVRFADAVHAAAALAPRAIEIGPHPTLSGLAALSNAAMTVHPSLHREHDAWETLMGSAAALYVAGSNLAWREIEPDVAARRVDLPRYPFERESLWVDVGTGAAAARRGGHPLLGVRVPQPGPVAVFDSMLDADAPPFIREHRVLGRAIMPGTAFLEMGLAAGRQALGGDVELLDVELLEPMQFEDDARHVHTRVDTESGTFAIFSAGTGDAQEWTRHCTGRIARATPAHDRIDLAAARAGCTSRIDGSAFSDAIAERGYDFGPRLRGVTEVHSGDGIAVGAVALPAACDDDARGYIAHPLLLDAAVQTTGAAAPGAAAARTWVPLSIDRVVLNAPVTDQAAVLATAQMTDARTLRATVKLANDAGDVLVVLEGMTFRELPRVARSPFLETRWLQVTGTRAEAIEQRRAQRSAMTQSLAELSRSEDAPAYDGFVEELEGRSGEYVVRAMSELGWAPVPGELIHADALAHSLGIATGSIRLFNRMLEILAEEGVLERSGAGNGWTVLTPLPSTALQSPTGAGVPGRAAEHAAERVLLDRCGPALAGLLRGNGNPLELLFPAGGAEDAERMYYDAPLARVFNQTIAGVVALAAAAAADGRTLRILEVGGGTAGTSRRVLDRLDADGLHVQYTFTDVSPLFIERARRRWADRIDVEYRTYDLDRDPAEQGFTADSFDVVIAANCLHAARDLGMALTRVRSLLRAGGMLAAVEVFAPHRWFDLTVGLTDGWWHFTDAELRPAYPCIGADAWSELLRDVGFDDAAALPLAAASDTSGHASRGQGVILAWRGGAAMHNEQWLVCGSGSIAESAAAALAARGAGVHTAGLDETRTALRTHATWSGVVLCEPGAAQRSLDANVVRAAVHRGIDPLMSIASAVGTGAASVGRLCIITRGAQVAAHADIDVDPAAATVWGAARTFELEVPGTIVQRLDLDATISRDDADIVSDWLLDAPAEPEIAVRHGARYARRLLPAVHEASVLPPEYRLTPPQSHSLDELAFAAGERVAPAEGQVEIRVVASGVNFKDVLSVLGMYPGDAGPLGSECAGIVAAVGDGVAIGVGTPVMAAAGHAYGRHVIADAMMVAPKPDSLTFAQAAAVPIAYLTAFFALEHLAHLQQGDRVLIHAAAGGVGMAAVAIAQQAGAEVFATAGSDEKRAMLHAMGVVHVFDSRSASFVRHVMEATGGTGVDVVLNSLADELVDRTFDVIAGGGRFLEIGKRGIWSAERVAALGRNIEYHIIDWGETSRRDPALVGGLYQQVAAAVARGDLPPLPVTTFPVERVADAFRHMAHGRHIGKIVLQHPLLSELEPISFADDGAYVITGGTAGLGLSTARWALSQGARELVLVSRRGAAGSEAGIESLRESGARIHVIAADAGDPDGVRAVIDALTEAGIERVRGVIHSAGALSDRTLQHATWDDFDKVLRAKVYGTALLADALAPFRPDFFVCYSSIASVFGAPGQANHAAANAFQDAFAATRVVRLQTGMSISWGPWSETGAAARSDVLERTRERGLAPLGTDEGLSWLERAFAEPAAHLVGAKVVDVNALDRRNSPLYEALRSTARPAASHADADVNARPSARTGQVKARFMDELNAAPVDARRTVLLNRIRDRIRRVLGLAQTSSLDADRPLGEIGLDSLLAVELRNVLAEDLEQRLPATLLFDHATPAALATHLHELVSPAEPAAAPFDITVRTDTPVGLVGVLEDMDDDDIDRLLAEKLKS